MFYFVLRRSCRGCSLGELAGLRVLFLQEQVRDLRVQEFLWELIVGVAALSNLKRSIPVKILHGVEGGDIEKVARTSKQISRICDCLSLFLSLVFISLALITYIFICLGLFDILHACIPCLFLTCLILCLCSHKY